MSTMTLSPEARALLITAIEGYLDHDLGYDLADAEREVAAGRPGGVPTTWTQEDLERMHIKERRLKELRAALDHGEVQLSGDNVALSGDLVSTVGHGSVPVEQSRLGAEATDDGEVIEDELIGGEGATDTALVIELIGDEYQVYSQEMINQPDGSHTPGKTGEVAQFTTYAEADLHFAELKQRLADNPSRASASVSEEQTRAALGVLNQQAASAEGPGLP